MPCCTGDTILGRGTTIVAWPDGDLGDYLTSLDRLSAIDGVPVLPGHGPALADCGAIAADYRAHRDDRLVRSAPRSPPARVPRPRSSRMSTRTSTRCWCRRPSGPSAPRSPTWIRTAVTCPVCGTVAVPGARFCHNCGTRAAGRSRVAPAAERRVVTVLFGDLSDFTAWAEDLDPERVGAVTDRVLAALAGAVKTFGGHVDKLTGDGIMAVFGAPVAHEDDAERAVRAALSMQRAVRRVLDDERGGGAPSGLRVGLNTGEVVAGVQAGLEYTVIGDAVNTAARLADAAAIGTVYAGERTAVVDPPGRVLAGSCARCG